MTEMTNPMPSDPAGASAQPQDSHLVDGSQELLDGASTGTEDGPAGVPASLAGADTSSPLQNSAGRGDSADSGTAVSSSSGGAPVGTDSVRGGSAH